MTFALITEFSKPHRDAFEAKIARGVARCTIIPVGDNWPGEAKAQAKIDEILAGGQLPCVWSTVSDAEVQALGLPAAVNMAHVATLAKILEAAKVPVLWHWFYEGLRWVKYGITAQQFTDTFNAGAAIMPANVTVEVSMEPGSTLGKISDAALADWLPSRAAVVAVDVFGATPTTGTPNNKRAKLWLLMGRLKKLPLGIGEAGCGKNVGDVSDPAVVKPWLGSLFKFTEAEGCAYLSIWTNMEGSDWVSACPAAVEFTAKKFKKGGVIVGAPLIAVPAGGGFPVVDADT